MAFTLEDAKKLFADEFKTQLNSFMQIIAGNRQIFTDEIKNLQNEIISLKNLLTSDITELKKEMKSVKKDIEDLQLSVEHVDEISNRKIDKMENELKLKIEQTNEYVNEKLKEIDAKHIELEDRARRNNIRVDGIPEDDNETWDDSKSKVFNLVKEKMGLEIDIQRAHRVGKKNDENERPRTIVAYLLKYTDREQIFKNGRKLKDSGVFINEDFCRQTMLKRKELREKAKELGKKNIKTKIVYNRLIYLNDYESGWGS